jgi:hypothetical protein
VAIPLWVVRETNAPRWWVSVLMMINTIAVMLFQVAASKGSATLMGGAKHYRLASYFISVACVLYAYAQGVNAVIACLMLTLGMASHIVGELIGSAGSWSIGFGLADENHQGQYQGVWGNLCNQWNDYAQTCNKVLDSHSRITICLNRAQLLLLQLFLNPDGS